MRTTEQYLKMYDFTIPFTDGMLSFYDKNETELEQGGKIIAKGKVTDLRFCEDGELRITSPEKGTDYLAFEMCINGNWYGPFNSFINTPPLVDSIDEFVNQAKSVIENLNEVDNEK